MYRMGRVSKLLEERGFKEVFGNSLTKHMKGEDFLKESCTIFLYHHKIEAWTSLGYKKFDIDVKTNEEILKEILEFIW